MSESLTSGKPWWHRRWLWALVALVCILLFGRGLSVRAANSVARYYLDQQSWAQAEQALELSQFLQAENGQTALLLAKLNRKQGNFEIAMEQLAVARRLGAEQGAESEYVLILAESGRIREALPYLDGVLEDVSVDTAEVCHAFFNGIIDSRAHIGTAYRLLKAWEEATPNSPEPHFQFARLCLTLQDTKLAEENLRQTLLMDPEHTDAAQTLGRLLVSQQRLPDALQLFEQAAASQAPPADIDFDRGQCLRLLGQSDAARTHLDQYVAQHPEDVRGQLELARLEIRQRDYQKAIARLETALEVAPEDHELKYALATALKATGDSDRAKPLFTVASAAKSELSRATVLIRDLLKRPNDAELRRAIGRIMLQHGRRSEGLVWLESALQINPRHVGTLQTLIEYYDAQSVSDPEAANRADKYRRQLHSSR